jgi:hypothetical protein
MRLATAPTLAAALLLLATGATADIERTEVRAPCAQHDPLRRPWFGDLHVHSAFSLDAATQGTRNGPREAYRFARGEPLDIPPYDSEGRALRTVQLARPLDFAAVTDHAELLGELEICGDPALEGHDSWVCWLYRGYPRAAFFAINWMANSGRRFGFCGEGGALCLEAARTPWREIQEAAEAAYDRSDSCSFTSFVAYEWTGAAGAGNNLHRNVIFRNERVPELPPSFIETLEPVQLWSALRRECSEAGSGCAAIVIPHNSNLSAGHMWRTQLEDGSPIPLEEARARNEYERLVEVMQHKGDSECLPGLGSSDELCGFEKLAFSSFRGRYFRWLREPPEARQFVRNILKQGLLERERLGVNPFRLGIVASTDTHLATPGLVDESARYPGHGGAGQPARAEDLGERLPDDVDFNPGGLAVLWAEENSRDSLYHALDRREAYGTSGPRLVVRLFGGWDYPGDLCTRLDFARRGYASGVPMGGELSAPPEAGLAPMLAVSALRDPGDTSRAPVPLQRVQIVKGWVEQGQTREAVYDVAGDPENGASVDPQTCEPRGSGYDALCTLWVDPDFDPDQPAFYYARVLENPTCRWSTQVCNAARVRCEDSASVPPDFAACCDETWPRSIQERAWTSPIWYGPEAR